MSLLKKRVDFQINNKSIYYYISLFVMIVSLGLRLFYYIPRVDSFYHTFLYLILPITGMLIFIIGTFMGKLIAKISSQVGIVFIMIFFLIKTETFDTTLHKVLCCILYISIISIYILTINGIIPFKIQLYLLAALPFLFHIFVEDTRDYIFKDPPVPYIDWIPEITILLIMVSLFFFALSLKKSEK